jgi:hypothetical protein
LLVTLLVSSHTCRLVWSYLHHTGELASTTTKLEELEAAHETATTALAALQAQHASLTDQHSATSAQLADLKAAHEALVQEKQNVTSELESEKDSHTSLKEAHAALQVKAAADAKELEETKEALNSAEAARILAEVCWFCDLQYTWVFCCTKIMSLIDHRITFASMLPGSYHSPASMQLQFLPQNSISNLMCRHAHVVCHADTACGGAKVRITKLKETSTPFSTSFRCLQSPLVIVVWLCRTRARSCLNSWPQRMRPCQTCSLQLGRRQLQQLLAFKKLRMPEHSCRRTCRRVRLRDERLVLSGHTTTTALRSAVRSDMLGSMSAHDHAV